MDVLQPLPVFPRPPKRGSPPSLSRYHFSSHARVRSLTTPANQAESALRSGTSRIRRLTAPRTPDLGGSPDPSGRDGGGSPGGPLVVELAPMDEIDYLLLFLPAPLLPNLIEQLKRIDNSHRRLQELQDERIRQANWTRTMLELKAIKRQSQAIVNTSLPPRPTGSSPDLAIIPPTPIKATHDHTPTDTYTDGLVPTSHQQQHSLLPSFVPHPPATTFPPPVLSALAPAFHPPTAPLGPTPTLKTLFTALRAVSARLDALSLPHSATDLAPLWADIAHLDTYAHGPKWKNWRRERTLLVNRLQEATGRAANEDESGKKEKKKRESLGSETSLSSEGTMIVCEAYASPERGSRSKEGDRERRGVMMTPTLSPSLSMSPSASSTTDGGGLASMPATPAILHGLMSVPATPDEGAPVQSRRKGSTALAGRTSLVGAERE